MYILHHPVLIWFADLCRRRGFQSAAASSFPPAASVLGSRPGDAPQQSIKGAPRTRSARFGHRRPLPAC
jgi:hypothetical protein